MIQGNKEMSRDRIINEEIFKEEAIKVDTGGHIRIPIEGNQIISLSTYSNI